MIKLIFFIVFLNSIGVYLFAPEQYSASFCVVLTIIYIIQSVLFLFEIFKKNKFVIEKNKWINFHFIFLITNFFVDFVYPAFIYPIDPTFFYMFTYYFDVNLINKGVALCFTGMNAYMFGVLSYTKYKSKKIMIHRQIENVNFNKIGFTLIHFFCFCVFLYTAYVLFRNWGNSYVNAQINAQASAFFVLLACTVLILNSVKYQDKINNNFINFIKKNCLILLQILIFSVLSLKIGTRLDVLSLGIVVLFIYSYFVKKIRFYQLVIIGLIGIVGLTIVARVRNYDPENRSLEQVQTVTKNERKIDFLWKNTSDLIINNRNIYVGLDYVEENGTDKGAGIFVRLLDPIPLLPSYISPILFNKRRVDFSSQEILTNYTRDHYGYHDLNWEQGSQVFIDIYISLGFLGVILILSLFGWFIEMLENKKKDNIYLFAIYMILLSNGIFMVRGSLFESVRSIAWICLLLAFCLMNNKHIKNNANF